MSHINIRITGKAGRITLTRPQALNALTYEMCMAIDAALMRWHDDDAVDLVIIDAQGERAFCAGGDIAELYATGTKGDYAYGQRFWADEYRMNHLIFTYPKPIVSFLHGFTMGGGVGIGCHGSHRIVGEDSQISMPECGIGLVPDVGGSLMLALAPGRLGEYLSATATRMGPGDAIYAGFADSYIPQDAWPALIQRLETSGDVEAINESAQQTPQGPLQALQGQIDSFFAGETAGDIERMLAADDSDFSRNSLKHMRRNSPLSLACAVEIIHRLRGPSLTLEKALDFEYRFTFRAAQHSDFLEGVRAAIIDKDRNPSWQYADRNVPPASLSRMLAPLGKDTVSFDRRKL